MSGKIKLYDMAFTAPTGEEVLVLTLVETGKRRGGVRSRKVLERQFFVNNLRVTPERARRVAGVEVFRGTVHSRAA